MDRRYTGFLRVQSGNALFARTRPRKGGGTGYELRHQIPAGRHRDAFEQQGRTYNRPAKRVLHSLSYQMVDTPFFPVWMYIRPCCAQGNGIMIINAGCSVTTATAVGPAPRHASSAAACSSLQRQTGRARQWTAGPSSRGISTGKRAVSPIPSQGGDTLLHCRATRRYALVIRNCGRAASISDQNAQL